MENALPPPATPLSIGHLTAGEKPLTAFVKAALINEDELRRESSQEELPQDTPAKWLEGNSTPMLREAMKRWWSLLPKSLESVLTGQQVSKGDFLLIAKSIAEQFMVDEEVVMSLVRKLWAEHFTPGRTFSKKQWFRQLGQLDEEAAKGGSMSSMAARAQRQQGLTLTYFHIMTLQVLQLCLCSDPQEVEPARELFTPIDTSLLSNWVDQTQIKELTARLKQTLSGKDAAERGSARSLRSGTRRPRDLIIGKHTLTSPVGSEILSPRSMKLAESVILTPPSTLTPFHKHGSRGKGRRQLSARKKKDLRVKTEGLDSEDEGTPESDGVETRRGTSPTRLKDGKARTSRRRSSAGVFERIGSLGEVPEVGSICSHDSCLSPDDQDDRALDFEGLLTPRFASPTTAAKQSAQLPPPRPKKRPYRSDPLITRRSVIAEQRHKNRRRSDSATVEIPHAGKVPRVPPQQQPHDDAQEDSGLIPWHFGDLPPHDLPVTSADESPHPSSPTKEATEGTAEPTHSTTDEREGNASPVALSTVPSQEGSPTHTQNTSPLLPRDDTPSPTADAVQDSNASFAILVEELGAKGVELAGEEAVARLELIEGLQRVEIDELGTALLRNLATQAAAVGEVLKARPLTAEKDEDFEDVGEPLNAPSALNTPRSHLASLPPSPKRRWVPQYVKPDESIRLSYLPCHRGRPYRFSYRVPLDEAVRRLEGEYHSRSPSPTVSRKSHSGWNQLLRSPTTCPLTPPRSRPMSASLGSRLTTPLATCGVPSGGILLTPATRGSSPTVHNMLVLLASGELVRPPHREVSRTREGNPLEERKLRLAAMDLGLEGAVNVVLRKKEIRQKMAAWKERRAAAPASAVPPSVTPTEGTNPPVVIPRGISKLSITRKHPHPEKDHTVHSAPLPQ